MATIIVSEAQRAARDEMAIACAELACATRSLAEAIKIHPEFVAQAITIAANFERLEAVATSDHPISELNLTSCGRAFEDGSKELHRASRLIPLLTVESSTRRCIEAMRHELSHIDERGIEAVLENLRHLEECAAQAMREKLTYLEELINVSFVLVDLDLDRDRGLPS